MLVVTPFLISCDRENGATPATPAPSAAASPAASTPSQEDGYAQTLRPLMEELTRMRILLEKPATVKGEAFRRQYREVKLRHTQAEPALSAENRQRDSWKHISQAMQFLEKADRGLEREDALVSSAQRPQRSGSTADAQPPSLEAMQRTAADAKELALLSADLPRAMAAAGGAILLAEMDLRSGK